MSKVKHLNQDDFETTIGEGVSLVDFWAPWCGPCRAIGPIIDTLSEEFDGKANICKVNTDEQQEISVKYSIRSIPSILFFKNGELIDQLVGGQSQQVLADKINSLLN